MNAVPQINMKDALRAEAALEPDAPVTTEDTPPPVPDPPVTTEPAATGPGITPPPDGAPRDRGAGRRRVRAGAALIGAALVGAAVALGVVVVVGGGGAPTVPVVVVQNKVAVGPTALLEDATPAYLSTIPAPYCKARGCAVPGTDMASGAVLAVDCTDLGGGADRDEVSA